jgi:ComF family protein
MRLLEIFLDYLYPKYCLLCLKEGKYICNECKSKLSFIDYPCCPVCKGVLRSKNYFIHMVCKKHSSLDGLFSLLRYDEKTKLILSEAKFKFAKEILKEIGIMLKPLYSSLPFKVDYLVPVPLNIERLNYRGFNQSEIIAKELNWKYKNILIRTKITKPQAKSNRAERLNNLRDAFMVDNKYKLENKTIVLVDDVYTTGATLMECAKTLKLHKAKKVYALVWAKD